ncbi:uncharacterized protein LOC129791917 [Lutzomyia longipalpis]|uniref:uncharacterized protein LOC129791917 n=1 Tax=Lutzomyia longipalpis TaxID=7200 RepID=UPI0024843775|nr:uncharacterized protein LOC129791917 [Lutzomyia longipalpis]XP_055686517.1 uncharacterized protein LOC129791917 [Lutzomyia longipalpis]XP_055686518.1 uncharacterized protein LOC129791917 [Lutzomyia longipalpis]XP_055686519.1 uncharacterized protein LOC129791917 [Lutzomyia longipalpis]
MMDDAPILWLNNDCLLILFKYLKIEDLLSLEEVCVRFQDVVQLSYRTIPIMNFVELAKRSMGPISLSMAEKISRRVGPYVHHLNVSSESLGIPDECPPLTILEHFKQLRGIRLVEFDFSNETSIRVLSEMFGKMKSASFENCQLTDEGLLACFLRTNELEVFRLVSTECLTGKFLQGLRGLKEAELYINSPLEAVYFREFCEANRQLYYFELYGFGNINGTCVQSMLTNLRDLKTLSMCDLPNIKSKDIETIGDLVGLRNLELFYFTLMSDDIFDELLEKMIRRGTLEHLGISCAVFVKDSTLRKVARFQNLKSLGLKGIATDSLLAKLTCFPTLEGLDVSESKVTAKGLRKFIMKCPLLEFVDLSDNEISFKFIQSLGSHLRSRSKMINFVVSHTPIVEVLEGPTDIILDFLYNKTNGQIKFIYKN